ncbi:MAG: efflux transporter outer membrane subunit [Cardiobacteriaceae bacterium]|nr:efflux transporter outer membrane subunit [Cardiobacteriaceae bacterium]
MKTVLKTLPLAVMLAACSFTPEYVEPQVALPQSWMEVAIAEQDATGALAADLGWRDYFRDAQLQTLIAEALAHNHDLKKAALNVQIAQAQYGIQRTGELPQVNANGTVTRSRTPRDLSGTGHSRVGEAYSVGLGAAAFELDFYGRVQAMSEQALNRYFATREAHDAAQLAIIAAVAKTYYQARTAQAQLALAEDVLKTREESYRLSRLQFDAGLLTASALRGVEAQIESARGSAAEAKRARQQALNALSMLVGKPVSQLALPSSGELKKAFADIRLPAGIPASVLVHRPDIREAEYLLKAANANIGAARAALYPSVALTGSLGFGSTELKNLLERPNLSWNIGPSVMLPIFDRSKLKRNVDISEAQQQIAVENYQSVVQGAFYEVANALIARETLAEQYQAQQRGNKSVAERMRLEKLRFNAGVSTALDLLDAERESYASEQGLLATQLQILANNVDLYIAMGGGLAEYGAGRPAGALPVKTAK